MKAVLNVGGGSRAIPMPKHYEGWRCDRLDIDPQIRPDICLDARAMTQLPPATYDAVYCSHNLEHYTRRDAAKVVKGFRHVLRPDGLVEVIVPDLGALFKRVVEEKLDIDDVLYNSPNAPVLVRDVIYGFHAQVDSGNDFYIHKTGYTPKSLWNLFVANGFPHGFVATCEPVMLMGLFFLQPPQPQTAASFGLPVN
jgi:hypothetical protein